MELEIKLEEITELLADMALQLQSQARYLGGLTERIEALEAGKPRESIPPADGLVPRGKYRGKDHAWVLENDPWHIQWMADNGYAKGMGYSDEQIAAAKATPPQVR